MKTKMKKLALATLLAFTATASQALILIDNFNDPFASPGQAVVSDGNPATVTDTEIGLTGVLGGSRELSITCNSGCIDNDFASIAAMVVSNGELKWVNGTSVRSTASVTWDANGTGLNFNILDAGSTIVATILAADLGFNYVLTLFSSATDYTSLISGTVNAVVEGDAEDAVYEVSWFDYVDGDYFIDGLPFTIANFGAGVNLQSLSKINLTLNNVGTCYVDPGLTPDGLCSTAVDLRIDDARVVPEPGSMALAGLGLLGLAALRRRKQA